MSGDLAQHMAAVAAALLGEPNGRLSSKTELRFGTHGSLSVNLQKGVWTDFESNTGGGVLDLIEREKGLTGKDAFDFLRNVTGGDFNIEQLPHQPSKPKDDAARQHIAAWLWSKRRPITGTPAERYLHEARAYRGAIPAPLAFLPPHPPKYPEPAMIAAFGLCDEPEPGTIAPPREIVAVHLTKLRADGGGKADVAHPKIVIGTPRGLPIMLAPPNDLLGLAITEGIEDGLSVHEATGLGVWAAYSAGNLAKLAEVIPDYIEAVTIYAHDDNAGRGGAQTLAKALTERGIEVNIEGEGNAVYQR